MLYIQNEPGQVLIKYFLAGVYAYLPLVYRPTNFTARFLRRATLISVTVEQWRFLLFIVKERKP